MLEQVMVATLNRVGLAVSYNKRTTKSALFWWDVCIEKLSCLYVTYLYR